MEQLLREADPSWAPVLAALVMGGVSKANVCTWLKSSRLISPSTVVVANAFARDWLRNPRYPQMGKAIAQALKVERITFVIDSDLEEPAIPDEASA